MLRQISGFLNKISLTEKLLYLFIILVPVMRVPHLPFAGQKIQYSEIVFVILFFNWLSQFLKRKKDFLNVPLKFSLIGMLTLFLFSFIHSEYLLKSGIQFAGILYLACLYMLLCQLIDSRELWWRLVKCWCAVSLLIALTGICAYLFSVIKGYPSFLMTTHDFLGNVNERLVYRLVSVFRHPAMLTMYLHAGIVFGFVLAAKKEDDKKYYWGYSIVVLCFIAALLTKTRCNAGIALTLFCVLASMPKKNIFISLSRYIFFIYALVFMVAAVFITVWWIFPISLQRNLERQTISVEVNAVHQPYFIHHMAEIKIIRDFPFVGVGLKMYNKRQEDYISWADISAPYRQILPDLKEEDKRHRGTDPHSLYLGVGAETGLLGLGGMLFFFLQIIRYFFRKIKEDGDMRNGYINKVFLAGFVGFLFNGLYVDMLTVRSFWFLITMGVIYANIHAHKKIASELRR